MTTVFLFPKIWTEPNQTITLNALVSKNVLVELFIWMMNFCDVIFLKWSVLSACSLAGWCQIRWTFTQLFNLIRILKLTIDVMFFFLEFKSKWFDINLAGLRVLHSTGNFVDVFVLNSIVMHIRYFVRNSFFILLKFIAVKFIELMLSIDDFFFLWLILFIALPFSCQCSFFYVFIISVRVQNIILLFKNL